jgi:ribulose-5-phosphate 4-epimerase/fuculose-1-phosphate aldolase
MSGELRQAIVNAGRLLHTAGLAPGTSGNISVRMPEGILVTPTNSRLGMLGVDDLAFVDQNGELVSGRPPSKETPLHIGMYRAQPDCEAIVHVHSPHAVAVSCLDGMDADDALPPLTGYFVMRLGAVGLVPFFPPGAPELAVAVADAARRRRALLMSNHGAIVAARTLEAAVADTEELEQTAKLLLLLRGSRVRLVPEEFRARLAGG